MIEKIAKSDFIRKKIYMTKKIIDKNTTDLKFKNFNFANSNFAKFENFNSADINIANFKLVNIVAVRASLEDAVSTAFASTFSEKFYSYILQNC